MPDSGADSKLPVQPNDSKLATSVGFAPTPSVERSKHGLRMMTQNERKRCLSDIERVKASKKTAQECITAYASLIVPGDKDLKKIAETVNRLCFNACRCGDSLLRLSNLAMECCIEPYGSFTHFCEDCDLDEFLTETHILYAKMNQQVRLHIQKPAIGTVTSDGLTAEEQAQFEALIRYLKASREHRIAVNARQPPRKKSPELEKAIAFLRETLKDGEKAAGVVKKEGIKLNITGRTLTRAMTELNPDTKHGKWSLPSSE